MAANASARMSGIIALTYPSLLNPTTGPPESAYIPVIELRHNSYGIRRKIGSNIIDSLSMINILPCCNSYLLLTVRKLDGILASGIGGVNDWNSGNTCQPQIQISLPSLWKGGKTGGNPRLGKMVRPVPYSPGRTACAPSCGHAAGAPARSMRSSKGSDSSQ